MIIVDVPLGTDGTHADMVEPRSSDATRGGASAPVPPGGSLLGLGSAQPRC
jgi:hypothetical protein